MHVFTIGALKKMIEPYPDEMPICGFNTESGKKCTPVTFHINNHHKHDPKVMAGNRTISIPEVKQPTLVVYLN